MAQKTHADADMQRKRAAVAQPAHSRKLVADANSQAAGELHNCCPRALAQLEVQGTLLLVEVLARGVVRGHLARDCCLVGTSCLH